MDRFAGEVTEHEGNNRPLPWKAAAKKYFKQAKKQWPVKWHATMDSYSNLLHSAQDLAEEYRDQIRQLEAENALLRERISELEDAWMRDEAIQIDGSLRPSIADTARRATEAETENARLRELIKQVENVHDASVPWCPFCNWTVRHHSPDCPAFTQDGSVK